jgi:mannose-1-phosphate guanylyltransferase / phosphomannomutase
VLTLVLSTQAAPAVALPASVPRAAETMCRDAGAALTWTKLTPSHLMEVAGAGGQTFAASQDGGFIFPAFMPAFDAVMTLSNLLAMLAVTGLRLSKVVSGTPRFHVAHETVVTPWEQKGLVMRTLVERSKDHELVLVDGVEVIHEDGWALVLPDPEDPVTHVWAEADSARDATTRAQEYARRIRQMLR